MVNKLLKMMAYFPNNVVVRTRVDTPPRKILAALSLDFMDLFVPPSHYIPDRKEINKNKERKNGESVGQVHL
jgi:hypothetical protein